VIFKCLIFNLILISKYFIKTLNILGTNDLNLLYRVSQEECAKLWESVPYVKVYRYNPKHLCPNLNGYGQRSLKL